MAYNDTEWIDNSLPPIDEVNLNNIEQGITDAHNHMVNSNNPHNVNKTDVGLSSVNDTSDINKPVSTATQTALDLKSNIGHTHSGADAIDHTDLLNIGINTHAAIDTKLDQALYESDAISAVDDTNKLITENELDVHTTNVNNPHSVTAEQIGAEPADPNIALHLIDITNPHSVTKDQIGLGNVDNTSDADKPVSDDTQAIIDALDTDDITEAGNLYYTDIRADARVQEAIKDDTISLTSVYSSSKVQSLIEGSLVYQGIWDASTNTPTLTDAVGTNGFFYEVGVAGTQDLGSGSIDFILGDRVIHNGTIWEKVQASASANWGEIYGTLSNQTDLQNALDLKTDDTVFDAHTGDTANPHAVTKAQVGLPNVPDSIAQDLADHEVDFANPHLTTVSNLGDTSVVDASEGQRLSYNETTGLWEPRNSVSGLGFVVFDYNFDTDVTATPASGIVQMNNVDPTLATELYFHSIDRTGKDVDAYWSEIKEGDWFNIYRSNDTTRFYAFDAAGSATQNGSVWTVPVNSYLAEGAAIGDGNRVKVLWRISQTQVIDNLVTPRADWSLSANMGVVLKADVDTKVQWQGEWVSATYYLNDMVRDGVYSMIANKETTDRPAPQDVGLPYNIYNGTLTPVNNLASQIVFGTRYVASTAIKVTGYRVDVIAGNEYEVYYVSDPLGEAVINPMGAFTATTTGWFNVATNNAIIGNGYTFDMVVIVREPAGTPSVTLLNYDYDTPNNVGTPNAGQIIHANNDVSYLHINYTDNDAGNNTAFLQDLEVGDIIELDTVRWSIQGIVNNPSYITFQISPAVQYGTDGVHSFGFETVQATPITVGREVDYNASTSQSGLYIVDGKYEDITPDNNQYGADIIVQEVSISPDWDIVATSASAAGGGDDGGSAVEIVDNLTTQDAAKALSANQGYVLDNAKVANGRVLTDVPAGAVFTDTIYNDNAIQSEVDLNTAKETNIAHPLVETAVPVGAVFTDTDFDDSFLWNAVDLNTAKETNIVHPLVETAVPAGAKFTDTVYDDSAIQGEVDLNTAKVGITPQQSSDITSNNAKVTNVDHPTVDKAVPSNAEFTDTVYTHPTTPGNKHLPSGGSVGQVVTNTADGNGTWQDAGGGGEPDTKLSTNGEAIVKTDDSNIKSQCTAWVNFDGGVSSATIRDSFNVSNVSRTGTGEYTITFAEQMDNSDYSISATADFFMANKNKYSSNTISDAYVMSTDAYDNSLKNSDEFFVQIFGGKN